MRALLLLYKMARVDDIEEIILDPYVPLNSCLNYKKKCQVIRHQNERYSINDSIWQEKLGRNILDDIL